MAFAIALILLVIGTVVFHVASPWWFTPIASNWGMMDDTVKLTFWVTGVVFVAVNLFMAYCVVRYRHRKGREQRSEYEPENRKLEWWLTIVTSVGVAAMLAPGLLVWAKFVTVPEGTGEIEALGQQWTWSYRLPGEDGVLGATDPAFVTVSNQFGIDKGDDKGRDDILVASPELHLPIDQPVKVLLRSKDVLHNFTVAEFRVKMDLVPGMVTYMWLTPTRTGAFDVLCEELCGVGHFAMRGRVVLCGAIYVFQLPKEAVADQPDPQGTLLFDAEYVRIQTLLQSMDEAAGLEREPLPFLDFFAPGSPNGSRR